MTKPIRPLVRGAVLLLALTLLAGPSGAADLDAAIAAYEAGDDRAAEAAFSELAATGEVEAMYHLGVMQAEGRSAIVNDSIAASWFRRAANQGHAMAQVRLAEAYESGRGVPLDLAAAADWYRKAADQGVGIALYRFGVMTIEGRGVAADEPSGIAMIEQAAAAGDAEAQAYLAPPPEPAPEPTAPAVAATVEGEVVVPAETETQAAEAAPPAFEPFVAEPADPDLSPAAKRLYDWIVADFVARTPPGAVIRHGHIAIEERAQGFHVVIPNVIYESHVDEFRLNLGTFEAEVAPKSDDVYGIVMTLPSLMTIDDDKGHEVAHATLGESRFEGTWAPATGGYLDQTLSLKRIVVASAEVGIEARIDEARYETALAEAGRSRVSGPSAYAVQGIAIMDGQGRRIVRIGRMHGTSEVRGLDRGILTRINNGMAELGEADRLGKAPDLSFLPPDPGAILGGARMDVAFEDIEVAMPTGEGFAIARLSYATSVSDLDTPLARFDMQYRHDGLAVAGPDAGALVPDLANIDIAVEKLPAAHLYALALAAGVGALADPGAGPEALFADLPRVFAEAGTRLDVAAIDLAAAGAEAHATGSFTGDPAASGGVSGSFTMFASGLEGAIQRLTGDPNDMQAQQAGFFLSMLQSLGAPETAENGEAVLAYRLEIKPDGRHMLNGRDLEQLMGGLMGGQ